MASALAIRHIDFEDLGTLDPLLRGRGYDIRYVNPAVEDLAALDPEEPELLIILGGPIGAYDEELYPFLKNELALVGHRLECKKPILGICLGAQLIARALGAKVYPLGVKEIGFAPLNLTDEGRQSPLAAIGSVPVLHWHGDQFDIPEGALRLAGTAIGRNQAFAMGRNVLGLQFHLEVDVNRIERWLVGHACELVQAGIDPRVLREQAKNAGAMLISAAQEVLASWLDGAEASSF